MLVRANLNTHRPASLCETFARRRDRGSPCRCARFPSRTSPGTGIRWGLPDLAALAIVPVQGATTINFAVHHPDDNVNVTSANLSGPNVVAAGVETWNLASNPTTEGVATLATRSGLLNSTGTITGVGVSFVEFGGPDGWGYGSALKLLWRSGRGFYNGSGNAQSFTINGLTPGATFDLWIASSHLGTLNSAQGVGDWSTANTNTTGASVVMNNTGQETNGSTWVSGVNYARFENIVADSSGLITMTSHAIFPNPTDSRIGFNGFQLVSVDAVPEPSRALLAVFGLLGLVLRRRRA